MFIKHSSGDVTPSSKTWLKDNEMSRVKNMRQCLDLTQYKTTVEYRAHEHENKKLISNKKRRKDGRRQFAKT